ncbi:protein FAR1-RELATED SEQUENCE 6-like [Cicer arietinum]|uniref:protein FAR1-RELATED SEQUENCE 6-like n=1 Tax=Cicer arietinum TaxID=3827 RepID=UPI003CC6474F
MRKQNSDFLYDIDLDDDFHVRNVFWADARSRATYEYFGDVVTFDTTYLTNKYGMPFVVFVGVNHHGQSTLLGCGMLSGEDTNSLLYARKDPFGWCLWHIMKKIHEKHDQYSEYKKIKFALKEAVYNTITKHAFEEKWCSFIEKFELQQNDWLNGLYNERHRWAPTLLKKYFWAVMSTTQRSETIHFFFDDSNCEIVRNHNESNICIESSIEANESNTLVGSNTSFLNLLSQFSTTM